MEGIARPLVAKAGIRSGNYLIEVIVNDAGRVFVKLMPVYKARSPILITTIEAWRELDAAVAEAAMAASRKAPPPRPAVPPKPAERIEGGWCCWRALLPWHRCEEAKRCSR